MLNVRREQNPAKIFAATDTYYREELGRLLYEG